VGYWTWHRWVVEMKTTGTALRRGPNRRNRRPCYRIQASCYDIPGLNETVFRRKSLAGNGFPFWRVPTIYKPNPHKDLGSILAGGPVPGFRNSLRAGEMRRANKPKKIQH
jgi:hypothetical protein